MPSLDTSHRPRRRRPSMARPSRRRKSLSRDPRWKTAMPLERTTTCAGPRHMAGINAAPRAARALGSELLSAAVSSNPKWPGYSVRRVLSSWVATAVSASVSKGREPAPRLQNYQSLVPCPRKMWIFYSCARSLKNRTIARNFVSHRLGIANAYLPACCTRDQVAGQRPVTC